LDTSRRSVWKTLRDPLIYAVLFVAAWFVAQKWVLPILGGGT